MQANSSQPVQENSTVHTNETNYANENHQLWAVIVAWENEVKKYTDQSGRDFPDNFKISVMMKYGHPRMRSLLSTNAHLVNDDWNVAKNIIKQNLEANIVYDNFGAPDTRPGDHMDVNWIDGKGKGKHGGKHGKWGKDKKGKDKKGKKGKKGDKSYGGGDKSSGKFQGNCGYRGKYGHKRADCRKRIADKAASGQITNQAQAAAETSEVKSIEWDMDSDLDDDQWIGLPDESHEEQNPLAEGSQSSSSWVLGIEDMSLEDDVSSQGPVDRFVRFPESRDPWVAKRCNTI